MIKISDEIYKRFGINVPCIHFFEKVTRQGGLCAQEPQIECYDNHSRRFIVELDLVEKTGLGTRAEVAFELNFFRLVAEMFQKLKEGDKIELMNFL